MATPTLWSPTDFLVNTTTLNAQGLTQAVGLKDGTFLIVWRDASGQGGSGDTSMDIRAQIFNADGTKKGAEILVNTTVAGVQDNPRVAVLNDGRFVIGWTDSGSSVRVRVFNADGTATGPDISAVSGGITSISALANGGFVIATSAPDASAQGTFALAFDATIKPLSGGPVAVNTTTANPQWEGSVAGLSNGNYVVLFTDQSRSSDDPNPTVRGRIFKPDGTAVTAEFLVPSSRSAKTTPKVTALANGKFVVVWNHVTADAGDGSGSSIKGQIFNADGSKSGGEFLINGITEGDQTDPSIVALANGGFAVSYTIGTPGMDPSFAFLGYGVATFDQNGSRNGSDLNFKLPVGSLPTNKWQSSIGALADGRLVLSWEETGDGQTVKDLGVYARILEPRDTGVTITGDVTGNTLPDDFIGTKYADTLIGKAGDDRLTGDDGNDILIGGAGSDTLNGGNGNDTVSYAGSFTPVIASLAASGGFLGEAGGDVFISIENLTGSDLGDRLTGDNGDNILDGADGDDILVGGGGGDSLVGGKGKDQLDGGSGVDTMVGGAGDDTYIVDNAGDKVVEAAGGGTDTVTTSVSYVLAPDAEVEKLFAAAGSALINLTGSSTANELYGNSAANVLDGSLGADILTGYDGDDTYIIDDLGDVIVEQAGQGNDTVVIGTDFAADHTYRLSSFANVESIKALNSAGVVNLTGNLLANAVTGNDSANLIDGGDDSAVDTLTGGKGNDTYLLHDKNDIIVEVAGEGTDTVLFSGANYTLDDNLSIEFLEADTSRGINAFTLAGNNLANTIKGASGRDVLDGGGTANDPADQLEGGAGDDTYIIRHEGDVIVENAGGGNDKLISYVNYALKDASLVESIEAAAGTQKIALTGNSSANTMTGNAGENVFEGRGGNDTIYGGGGMDTAAYTGSRSEYTVVRNADGSITVADGNAVRDGTDTLWNVKYVRFNDQIIDLDAQPTLSIAAMDANKAEGNGTWTDFTFIVTRANALGPSSATWTVTGMGTNAATADDFDIMTGTVSFVDGQTSATITVRVKADSVDEKHETFTATLSNPVGATIENNAAIGTIINDDTPVTISIAAVDAMKSEGDSGLTDYTFVVTRTSGVGAASASWKVVGSGTNAASDDDFSVTFGVVNFADGETQATVTVKVKGDTIEEKNEGFSVVLSDAIGGIIGTGSVSGMILNDDTPATMSIAATDATKAEGNTGLVDYTFTVTRSSGVGTASADWNVIGAGADSATADDFAVTSGTVTFAEGQTTATVTVKVKGDSIEEKNESFAVVLSNPTGAKISTESAIGTILNDDTPVTLSISATDAVKTEGNAGFTEFTFTVARSSSLGAASATWTVTGSDISDDVFEALTGTVSFAAGEATATIKIRVQGDTIVEGNETFTVTLSDPVGGTIAVASAVGTIVTDDFPDFAPSNIRLTTGGHSVSVDENKTGGYIVGTVIADDDKGAAGLRYSLSDSHFEIDSVTGQIRVKSGVVLDFEGRSTYTLAVSATDLNGTGQSTTQNITISVNDLNERATDITFTGSDILKVGTSGTGVHVTHAQAVDQDAGAGPGTNLYRFDNGQSTTPDGLFVINAITGEITTTRAVTAADVGTKTLNVVAYDATNPALFQVRAHIVSIVGEGNGAPTDIALSRTSIGENSVAGSLIGLLSAIDPQGASDIREYAILFDEDDKFVIEDNELRLKTSVDREVKSSHQVTIRVTDKSGQTYDETFRISVTDVNEKPSDIVFSDLHVLKVGATAIGASVMSAKATDLDPTPGYATNLYKFENGQTTMDGLFAINAYTGEVTTLRALTAADAGTRTLTIIAYDVSDSTLFQVKRQDVTILGPGNLAPTDLALDHNAIAENSDGKTVIGKLSATDTDVGETFTYSIASDPDGKFDIIGGNLVLKEGATLDYEAKGSHKVTIRVTDSGHNSYDKEFVIDVTNVNDAPTHVGLSGTSIDEAVASDTFVGNLVVTDQDASGSYVYELLDNAEGRFKLSADGKSILVADGSRLDYEAATSHTIRVKVTDGSFTRIDDIVINLNNKLEPGSPSIFVEDGLETTGASDDGAKVNPFAGVTFLDPENDELTVKISFNASAGELLVREGLDVPDPELMSDGTIVYTFKGTYDALAIIMDVLQFKAAPRPNMEAGAKISTVFTITAFDGTSLVENKEVKVVTTVTNRAPVDIALDKSVVSEIAGGEVGVLSATDQAGSEFTYELLDDAGGRFALATEVVGGKTITRVVAANGLLLDFEQAKSHTIRVKVTDKGGASFTKALVINVADLGVEVINGSAGNDVFVGGAGRDTIKGNGGNDIIYGGAGIDALWGGAGKDVFVFNTALNAKTNKDKIADWNAKDDTIKLENAIFKKLTKTGTLNKANFVLGAVAKDANDFIGYNAKTGDLWYDANGSGKGGQVVFANIGPKKAIFYNDFIVI